MIESYLTISDVSEGFYKEKGSKFIAVAFPADSEEKVKECLEELRTQYYDARHHCYAYVLGKDGKQIRANDDGEPNHSAGDPILGQIHSKQLTNVLVVVVRYFGGTKLGVSGLINAYKTSAEEALDKAKIKKIYITEPITLSYGYDATNEVMRLVSDFDINITNQEFGESCLLEGEVKIGQLNGLKEKVQLLIDTGSEVTLEIDSEEER